MSCKHYDKKEYKEQKEHHSYKIGTWKRKNLEARRQIGESENRNAEE
jgi:hypothetical protein